MGPHVSPCSKKRLPGAEGPPEGKRGGRFTAKGGYFSLVDKSNMYVDEYVVNQSCTTRLAPSALHQLVLVIVWLASDLSSCLPTLATLPLR